MGLDLDIAKLVGPGRPAVPLDVEYVRDLTEADLQLQATINSHMEPSPIKRITDRHHLLARLLASGTPEAEAAAITGYDNSRVSVLKNSPAFQELLALYQAEAKREFVSVLEHMAGMSRDALLELRSRLEENPDRFSNKDLKELVIDFADRAVDGDQTGAIMPDIIELVAPATPPQVVDRGESGEAQS
jgi:hypothetical protein